MKRIIFILIGLLPLISNGQRAIQRNVLIGDLGSQYVKNTDLTDQSFDLNVGSLKILNTNIFDIISDSIQTVPISTFWTHGTGAIYPTTITDELRLGSSTDLGNYILQIQGGVNLYNNVFRITGIGYIYMPDIAGTPLTPNSGNGGFYVNADKPYFIDDNGDSFDLTAGGVWDADTYGIDYLSGNVGVGIASQATSSLYVDDNDNDFAILANQGKAASGVYGIKSQLTAGTNASTAIYGQITGGVTTGNNSKAVYGENASTQSTSFGGYFTATTSSNGIGVYSEGANIDLALAGSGYLYTKNATDPGYSSSGWTTIYVDSSSKMPFFKNQNSVVSPIGSVLPQRAITGATALTGADYTIWLDTGSSISSYGTEQAGKIFVLRNRTSGAITVPTYYQASAPLTTVGAYGAVIIQYDGTNWYNIN